MHFPSFSKSCLCSPSNLHLIIQNQPTFDLRSNFFIQLRSKTVRNLKLKRFQFRTTLAYENHNLLPTVSGTSDFSPCRSWTTEGSLFSQVTTGGTSVPAEARQAVTLPHMGVARSAKGKGTEASRAPGLGWGTGPARSRADLCRARAALHGARAALHGPPSRLHPRSPPSAGARKNLGWAWAFPAPRRTPLQGRLRLAVPLAAPVATLRLCDTRHSNTAFNSSTEPESLRLKRPSRPSPTINNTKSLKSKSMQTLSSHPSLPPKSPCHCLKPPSKGNSSTSVNHEGFHLNHNTEPMEHIFSGIQIQGSPWAEWELHLLSSHAAFLQEINP